MVFSTSVEVFLKSIKAAPVQIRLLHVRGGVSISNSSNDSNRSSSPRPWRCFSCVVHILHVCRVFSTSVEVFLRATGLDARVWGLLHVRGGVSDKGVVSRIVRKSSPRPWRCFLQIDHQNPHIRVFSTSVEVFLEYVILLVASMGLLHVRGGVSCAPRVKGTSLPSSPRPWRCFCERRSSGDCSGVFSTSVEVFPERGI